MSRKKTVWRERRVEDAFPPGRVSREELRRLAGEVARILAGAETAPETGRMP